MTGWIITARRDRGALHPWTAACHDEFTRNVKDGAFCLIQGISARNPKQLALFWTLVGIVAEAMDWTPKKTREWVQYELGFTDNYTDPWGRKQEVPKSISFTASLTQREFSDFFEHAVAKFAEKLVHCERDDLLRRFEEVLSGRNN